MKFERFFIILVIAVAGIGTQQYLNYAKQMRTLNHHLNMSKANVSLIDIAVQDEDALLKQLNDAESLYQQLRTQLPEVLSEAEFNKALGQLTEKYNIKVLAKTQAVYGRPTYREAVIAMTLETSDETAQRLFDELRAMPRIVHIFDKKRTDKDHLEISIAIYAADTTTRPEETFPACIDEPAGVWMPVWKPQLAARYTEYMGNCAFIQDFGEILFKQSHLQFLQGEIARLQGIVDQLPAGDGSAG